MFQTRRYTMAWLDRETTRRALDSSLKSINGAEHIAHQAAVQCGFNEFTVEYVSLAVREIMTNAVIHGNRGDIHKKVDLVISRTDRELRITISDQGDGFDPDTLPDPTSSPELFEGSGRGVFLARNVMDGLDVQKGPAGGTTVTMVKRIP